MQYSWSVKGNTRALVFLERTLARGELSHAYCFVGDDLTGARTLAYEFVEHIIPVERIVLDRGYNDKGSEVKNLTVHQIRLLIARLSKGQSPTHGVGGAAGRRVVLLDPPHRMSSEVSNALLKILEEPPRDVVFVLYASRIEDLLPTIASRCQIVRCYASHDDDMAEARAQFVQFAGLPRYARLKTIGTLDTKKAEGARAYRALLVGAEAWLSSALVGEDGMPDEVRYARAVAIGEAIVAAHRYGSSNGITPAVSLMPLACTLDG